jgi:hypothetical protein
MSAIPLHLQRMVERRWAAKLASLRVSAARKSTELNVTQLNVTQRFIKPGKNAAVTDLNEEPARTG